MIESFSEFLDLVDRNDASSHLRLRTEMAPESLWMEVISQRADLKRIVTLNKTLGDPVIRLLARDNDPLIRCDIANRRRLPLEVFDLLVRDPDESVRARIAWNKKTPNEVLKRLLTDESRVVIEAVRKKLDLIVESLKGRNNKANYDAPRI